MGLCGLSGLAGLGALAGAAGDLARDTFTDANGVALTTHTPEAGGAWALAGSMTFDIQSNRARLATATGRNCAYLALGVTDVGATVTVNIPTAFYGAGVALRVQDNGNFWAVRAFAQSNVLYVVEINNGSETLRASVAGSVPVNTDHVVHAEARGTTISGTLDGGSVVTYNGATFLQSRTWHGLDTSGPAGTTFDDYRVTL